MSNQDYYNYTYGSKETGGQDDCDYDPFGDTGVLSHGMNDTFELGGNSETQVLGQNQNVRGELVRLNTGMRYLLYEGYAIAMGRGQGVVHIYVENPSVSHMHVQVDCAGGRCGATDLASTNGTYINERRLTPGIREILNNGEYLTLGNEIFQFWQR